MLTRLGLRFLWLLHFLPLRALVPLGKGVGKLLYVFGRRRRHIALTNLRLCFPDLDEAQRVALVKRHFQAVGRAFLERGLLWWATAARIQRLVKLSGAEHLDALYGKQPVILLAPHFVGIEAAWTRMSMNYDMSGIYMNQSNRVFNAALYKGRARFGKLLMLSRKDSPRKSIKALKAGMPLFYQPDMDYGWRDALFVPFFGVPAATITGLSRLARLTGATIVPVIARMREEGYLIDIGPPWQDYPGESIEADTRRMNAWIESRIAEMPEQYYWVHRRFKTRPAGEKRPY